MYDFVYQNAIRDWIGTVSNVFDFGENNRFRFMTDPLFVILLGIYIPEVTSRVRSKKLSEVK